MQLMNELLRVNRLEKHLEEHYEIKDPSVVKVADGSYILYASVGNSVTQTWLVGRFVASHPTAEWQEIEPVSFTNLSGPQLCAPAVTYQLVDGGPLFEMYIQTACFEDGGQIVYATSSDGQVFVGQSQPLVTKDDVNQDTAPVVGVYDVGVSEVKLHDQELICMLYSGYRKVGCGDIYASYKQKGEADAAWSRGEPLLIQENVPFHNRPDYEHFEWGLEGAKLVQIADDCFMIIGVCFMPKPHEFLGTRQRVFLAASASINGPFKAIGLPFTTDYNADRTGENGHPDTIIEGDQMWVIYQERLGDGKPWHLRAAAFNLAALETFVRGKLNFIADVTTVQSIEPEAYYFNYAF
ncbi:hypothetical protein KBC79_05635 [Candidatus Woesebacteria bacterium]|nr:hypothetical protein [Candidatus Woesebacteria bacterium]